MIMNLNAGLIAVLCLLGVDRVVGASAQEPAGAAGRSSFEHKPQASQDSGVRSQADLEKEFQQTLSGAVLTGTFRMVGKGMGRQEQTLSDPIPERYVIEEVSKVLDDAWLVKARIQYGEKDVTVPVMVRVLWAGDTPVITVDQAAIPLIGTYSARVMVFRGYYSGAWFGAGYGGVMSGQITRLNAEEKTQSDAAPRDAAAERPASGDAGGAGKTGDKRGPGAPGASGSAGVGTGPPRR